MLECAISFHAENRIINFNGTDIRLENDNIRGCLCMYKVTKVGWVTLGLNQGVMA